MDMLGADSESAIGLSTDRSNDEQVIPVIQEFSTIESQVVETGKLRISKSVTEKTAVINIPIVNESYQVHHVAGSPILMDEPPVAIRKDGDTTIISVIREVSVVVKKYELLEELHITRHVTQTPLTQEIVLRTEHVQVARTNTTT